MLGFGRIGQQVARRALGLGMRVVAYDPFVAKERFRELGVERVESAGRRARRGRVPDAAPAADAGDARLHRPRGDREDARRRAGRSTPRAASSSTRTRWSRRCARASSPPPRSTSSPQEPYSGPLLELDNVVVTPHLAASTEEAQDRAGVIVAEQVVAALEGGLVTNAVNIPVDRRGGPRGARPVHPARREARAAGDGARRGPRRADHALVLRRALRLRHAPADRRRAERRLPGPQPTSRSTTSTRRWSPPSAGSRSPRSGAAPAATSRTSSASRSARTATRSASPGTTIGNENRHWLVSALGFELEMELAPLMVFFRYDDVPGVIGRVGTLFGEAGVNIANMAVSRTPPRRQGADGALARRARRRPSWSRPCAGRASTTRALI